MMVAYGVPHFFVRNATSATISDFFKSRFGISYGDPQYGQLRMVLEHLRGVDRQR